MRDCKERAEYAKEQLIVVQTELGIREEELKKLKGQCFKMEKELSRFEQEHHECRDYIHSFGVQINSK
jgi:predicted transcriptional regulator